MSVFGRGNRRRLLAIWIGLPVFGIALAWLAHHLIPSHYSLASPSPAETQNTNRAKLQGRRLIACYGAQLSSLASAVSAFKRARITDAASLTKAAEPMAAAMEQKNSAVAALTTRRLDVSIDALRASPHDAEAERIACQLRGAELYQWDQLRPTLNRLLVDVIAIWSSQKSDSDALARVNQQQTLGWNRVSKLLEEGVRRFASLDLDRNVCLTTGAPK